MQGNQIPGVVRGLKKTGWKVSDSDHDPGSETKEFSLFHTERRQTMDIQIDYGPDDDDFDALTEE